ncbi:hypothetical protein D3C80_2207650 [compost metagenome]
MLLTFSIISAVLTLPGVYSTCAVSSARFTFTDAMPGIRPSTFSIRVEQAAQVIPVISKSADSLSVS